MCGGEKENTSQQPNMCHVAESAAPKKLLNSSSSSLRKTALIPKEQRCLQQLQQWLACSSNHGNVTEMIQEIIKQQQHRGQVSDPLSEVHTHSDSSESPPIPPPLVASPSCPSGSL